MLFTGRSFVTSMEGLLRGCRGFIGDGKLIPVSHKDEASRLMLHIYSNTLERKHFILNRLKQRQCYDTTSKRHVKSKISKKIRSTTCRPNSPSGKALYSEICSELFSSLPSLHSLSSGSFYVRKLPCLFVDTRSHQPTK